MCRPKIFSKHTRQISANRGLGLWLKTRQMSNLWYISKSKANMDFQWVALSQVIKSQSGEANFESWKYVFHIQLPGNIISQLAPVRQLLFCSISLDSCTFTEPSARWLDYNINNKKIYMNNNKWNEWMIKNPLAGTGIWIANPLSTKRWL